MSSTSTGGGSGWLTPSSAAAATGGSSYFTRPRLFGRSSSNVSTASSAHTAPEESYDALAGHLGHLSGRQQQALLAFKALLFAQGLYTEEPRSHDDATLLRYLRARKWDLQAALHQLKETDEWRKASNVDTFFENHDIETYDVAGRVYPCWTGRRSKLGHPLFVYRVQDLDKKVMGKFLEDNSNKKSAVTETAHPPAVVALYESLLQCVAPLSNALPGRPNPEAPITANCSIIDISGVSLSQFFSLRGHLGDASSLATARYPETLNNVMVVNAPMYLDKVMGFISTFFDERMRAKIKIVGSASDPAATLAGLKELIHEDDIPKGYGGNLDWDFGAPPKLDPVILRTWGVKDGVWPNGPVKVVGGAELVAMGTTKDGKKRRDVIGKLQPATSSAPSASA